MKESDKKMIRITILATATVMIIAGISGGEYRDVLSKAVMICMECIGIG